MYRSKQRRIQGVARAWTTRRARSSHIRAPWCVSMLSDVCEPATTCEPRRPPSRRAWRRHSRATHRAETCAWVCAWTRVLCRM
eukprot:1751215-Prymnesium_polylepis.1